MDGNDRVRRYAVTMAAALLVVGGSLAIGQLQPTEDETAAKNTQETTDETPQLLPRSHDGEVKITVTGDGANTTLKIINRAAAVCTAAAEGCASEITWRAIGRPLLATERIAIERISAKACFENEPFTLTQDYPEISSGPPVVTCAKGDAWLYKAVLFNSAIGGDPIFAIDPGVIVEGGGP